MDQFDPFLAHLNARIRGMRSHLFTREQYEELLDAGDVDSLTKALLNSPYQRELAESLTRYQGADAIEDAVSRNLVSTFQKLLRATEGMSKELAEVFFQRWDLIAVKSLLRVKHHGYDAQTGEASLVPGPTMTVPLLNEFAALGSMDALVAALARWNSKLCKGLVERLPQYQQTRDLRVLEDALDQNYFVRNVRELQGSTDENAEFLRRALQMEIDRINVRGILARRPDEPKEEAQRRTLRGGRIYEPALSRMLDAKTPEEVIEALEHTAYRELARGLYQLVQTNRFSPLERLFEAAFLAQLTRLSRTHSLSLAVLLHYTWLKYNEVVNLRVIARGEARHLPKGRLREEIIYA